MTNRISLACLLAIALTASGCAQKSNNENVERVVPVKTMTVGYASESASREYIGEVEGDLSVDESFLVGGNVEQIFVQEGQKVRKGDLLARIDATSLRSIHDAAKATLARAQDAYDRLKQMHDNNSLPDIKFMEAKTALEQARSAERVAGKNLADCDLKAPFSGIVGKRHIDAGANVMPGSPVCNIVEISSVKVKIAIPEHEISDIVPGQECRITVSALGGKTFKGRIVEKGVAAHPISHTYSARAKVANKELDLMPGMVCKAYIAGAKPAAGTTKLMSIPVKSVQIDAGERKFVWLRDGDSKAVVREVTTDGLSGNDVIITGGLNEGDELITEGYQNISPGIKVSVDNN